MPAKLKYGLRYRTGYTAAALPAAYEAHASDAAQVEIDATLEIPAKAPNDTRTDTAAKQLSNLQEAVRAQSPELETVRIFPVIIVLNARNSPLRLRVGLS